MESDSLQEAWSRQDSRPVAIDEDMLLRLVKRNHGDFRAVLLRRDALEIGIALMLTVVFARFGISSANWSWFVLAAGCLFVALFMLVDRYRQNRKAALPGETLVAWVEGARLDVEHQIWLLRNVFWWYLLPFLIGLGGVFGHDACQAMRSGSSLLSAGAVLSGQMAFVGLVYAGVYWLNRYAVRANLEPRLEELQQLAEGLTCDEA